MSRQSGEGPWAWAIFCAACLALCLGTHGVRASAAPASAGTPSLQVRRAVFVDLARTELRLRRRLEAEQPGWPWRADHELHQAMARHWEQAAARHDIALHRVAEIVDEGLREGWAPRLPAFVPPLAPIPPGAAVR